MIEIYLLGMGMAELGERLEIQPGAAVELGSTDLKANGSDS
jgi:hypothetical protein